MDLIKNWRETYPIGAYDTDIHGKIKLSKLTGYLQEAAWLHASHLGLGKAFIHQTGLAWVLSSIKIHMEHFPMWSEKIIIETWPRDIDRLFYLRDMVIYNEKEEVIGLATSRWLIIDMKSKRPKIVETDMLKAIINPQKRVFEEEIDKLPMVNKGTSFQKQIDVMDFDLNKHVNSNRYVEIILGTFEKKFYQQHRVVDFQLNFNKEITETQDIVLKRQEIQDGIFLIEGSDKKGKVIYFQSFIGFIKNDY